MPTAPPKCIIGSIFPIFLRNRPISLPCLYGSQDYHFRDSRKHSIFNRILSFLFIFISIRAMRCWIFRKRILCEFISLSEWDWRGSVSSLVVRSHFRVLGNSTINIRYGKTFQTIWYCMDYPIYTDSFCDWWIFSITKLEAITIKSLRQKYVKIYSG